MKIIQGRLELDPAGVAALRPALRTMMDATLKEAGCLLYSLAIEDDGSAGGNAVLNISERWDDAADMAAHGKSAHMAAFNKALKGIVRSSELKLFEVAKELPLRLG